MLYRNCHCFFCIISLIKLPEILFGNVTGWLPVVMLSLYVAIAMPQGMNYSLLMECLFGTIYGMIMGTVFFQFLCQVSPLDFGYCFPVAFLDIFLL